MKRGILIFTVLSIILGVAGCKKSKVDILYDKKYIKEIKEVRKDIGFFLARNFIPGGSFAIMKDGKIIYSEGVGWASQDLEVKVNRDTKFRIGEVSELFTSAILQLMIDNGTLHPDSTVQHYLPDFPDIGKTMTINQLANHTSGLTIENEEEENWTGFNVGIERGLTRFKDKPLDYQPDLFQNVSMYNYNLLGAIMEKVTGKHFSNLLEEYVTDTLHLNNTRIDNTFQVIKGRTDFFDYNMISQVINATSRDLRYKAPSKGLLSNAEDLVKLGNAIYFTDYFTDKMREKMLQPVILLDSFPAPIANGWIFLETRNGGKMYGRKGTISGGSSAILVIPQEKMVIAGTTNLTGRLDEIPVFEIANHFLPQQEDSQQSKKDSE